MKMHLALPVKDINAARNFYTLLFEAEPAKVKDDYVKFEPEHLALNISFYQTNEPIDVSRHLGLQLETVSEVQVQHERLRAAGVVRKERATSVCCYAMQDKFWVQDPDGYEWELYVRLGDTEEKVDSRGSCCASTSSPEAAAIGCC